MATIKRTVKIRVNGLTAMKRKTKQLLKLMDELQKMKLELEIK